MAPVLARLAARLGLPAGTALAEVAVESDSLLWFVFQDRSGAQAWLAVAAAGGESWAFNGKTLKISLRPAPDGITDLHRRALERLGSRLDGTPFSRLLTLARTGAAKPRPNQTPAPEGAPRPRGEDRQPTPGIHCEDWSHPDHWREFCFFPAIEWCPGETMLGSVMFAGSACSIRYGDLECQEGFFYLHSVPQTPWAFTKGPGGAAPEGGPPEYLALIDDRDVIHGTGVRKVEELLAQVEKDQSPRSLQLYNCCIPMMTGDDVRGPLARFQQRTGRKVVYTDMSAENCHQESLSQHILRELSAPRPAPARPPAGRYNLAGFRRTRGCAELAALLADAGAELNAAILPEVSPAGLAGYGEAAVQALMPNAYYQEIYEVLAAQKLRTLQGCAPYGWEGTARWLRELGACLGGGVPARLKTVLAAAQKTLEPEWELLRRRAGGYRAGFVAGPGDAARLADPARSGGVGAPALLAEMGFGIDLLLFREKGGPADPAAAALLAGLPGAARHRLAAFASPAELRKRLRSAGLSLVYSNVLHDRRLTREGLAGFSLRDLEMGAAGALRTLRRLVERCETPFFRENARLPRSGA